MEDKSILKKMGGASGPLMSIFALGRDRCCYLANEGGVARIVTGVFVFSGTVR